MLFRENPRTRTMWAASDAGAQGSGAALEAWALGEINKAAQSGQLDLRNSSMVRDFLGSLGITPEKGGGRFLFNKFMAPDGPIAGLRAKAPSFSGASPGMGSMGSVRPSMGSPTDMARRSLVDRYGGGTLGTISSQPTPYTGFNPLANQQDDDEFGGY